MTPSADPSEPAFPAIPGAIVITGRTCCWFEVLAAKGSVAMVIDYLTPPAVGMSSTLAAWAEQQYARL